MTVNELLSILEDIEDKDMEVVLASDPEGNRFHTAEETGVAYVSMDDWEVEVLTFDEGDDEPDDSFDQALIIWP